MNKSSDIAFFGETDFRNEKKKFGIRLDDRRKHVYVIGKTGMGKSELLKNMAIQDIRSGRGMGFVDPHGEAAEELLNFVPAGRIKDVIYFNPSDLNYPITFNVMEKVDVEHRHLVASGLMGVFKKIWPDVWSARMEYILNNAILALLECPDSTLLGINRMLFDPAYRSKVVEQVKDPVARAFWLQEFSRYTQRYEVEATAAIQNKIGQFISSTLIRNIVGQTKSSIDMRKIMDEKKILILNLSKGRIGEDSSKLLGGLLITKLQLAAMSRVDIPEAERQDFFLYVDEFQNFATESFANILSEARKYRLDLILAHQYIAQMEETVCDAVFGNVGTLMTFRVGAEDAEYLEKEFSPEILATDLVNLPKYRIYLKLIVDGVASRPFSAQTLPPLKRIGDSNINQIIQFSRETYADSRADVEERIARWTDVGGGDGATSAPPNKLQVPSSEREPPTLYDAQCQKCNKWSKVPFKPEPGRPILCKPCLKKRDMERSGEPRNKVDESNVGAVNIGAVNETEKKVENVVESKPEVRVESKPEPKIENPSEGGEFISLENLLSKKPVAFSKSKEQNQVGRHDLKREIDRQELKKIINETLPSPAPALGMITPLNDTKQEESTPENDGNQEYSKGSIEPGETVDFSD